MPNQRIKRPETTLFLTCSVDGRLTSHDSNSYDRNKVWKLQPGIRSTLQRFYDFSAGKACSLTSGQVMKLAGVNKRSGNPRRMNFSLIVFDHTSSLTEKGVTYLAACVKRLYLICSPTFRKKMRNRPKNILFLSYARGKKLNHIMNELYKDGVRVVTIHSDGPMNARWLAEGLVDHLTVVIAPLLVGANGTPTLMDSVDLPVTQMSLVETRAIDGSYLFLRYNLDHSAK
jgi:riboflavin biosynthesis pyrimidine reductase